MPARRLVAAVLAAAIVAMACSEPDRSTAADELGDRIEAMASVADVTVSYNPDTAGSNESVRVLAVTEPAADPGDACATVAEFLTRFPDTGIEAREAQFEVRDEGGTVRWSFTATAADDAPIDATRAACVASQQARAIEAAYAVRATSGSDGARPGAIVNFRDGAVASAQAGLDAARATVADFDVFSWRIYVICGDALCDSAEG